LINNLNVCFEDVLIKKEGVGIKKIMNIPLSAYWKIESESFNKGGRVTYDKVYRLRHF
jgi:hypothetical protein